jgi:AraC-like DNA-binding protein
MGRVVDSGGPVPRTWSTLRQRGSRQFAYWRELICEAFLDLTPESDLRDGFTGVVTQWDLGALNLARIYSQRQRVLRTERDVARATHSGYYANLQVRGVGEIAQGRRVAVLRPGDLALVRTAEPFALRFGTDFRQLTLYLPAPLLEAQVPGRVPTATRIGTATGVGAAVRHSLDAVMRDGLAPASAARLATHAAGLLAVALEPAPAAVAAPVRSARGRAAALADIEEHLADEDLSPAATAARLGISVRLLHGYFAGGERSYAATVRRLRLEQARRALQDPGSRHLRVIDIAAEAGFGNVASFHRSFRREFGRTPAQVRSAAAPG